VFPASARAVKKVFLNFLLSVFPASGRVVKRDSKVQVELMRVAGIAAIVIAIFAYNSFSLGFAAESMRPASRVAGIVVDVNDARVVGASIRIENAEFKKVVRSDSEGSFEVEVPPGTYQLTVQQSGFKKFHLPAFCVEAGTNEPVKIHLEVAPPQMPLKVHSSAHLP
jgi:hypothetical protein